MRLFTPLLSLFLAAPIIGAPPAESAQAPALTPRDSALHALNRLAYGPRPGEVDRIVALGTMHWIAQQLDPGRLPDRVAASRANAFSILGSDPESLARMFAETRRGSSADAQAFERLRIGGQLQQLALVRAVLSERQLQEVMSDFWLNHFNVYFAKGADRVYLPFYVEETIRPRTFGRFEDLLVASAQSPAMMFYLDNWESVAQGAVPPGPDRPGANAMRPQAVQRWSKGPNENYARELLELHTLGVDGGYTQQDVMEVARIFTGWGIARPAQRGRFQFNAWAHDYGSKTVRGMRFPPGHGMDEGLRLLRVLASAPATARHVSGRLCARFVRDDPPQACVEAAAAAWARSRGDIREVLRAIFQSPEFWSPQAFRAKVKTPLEFMVSAVRAVGGDPDTTARLAHAVALLGEQLYFQPSPAGYPESQEDWVNSGALLGRMNDAVALGAGRLAGVTVTLDGIVPATADPDSLIEFVDAHLLGGILTGNTRDVLRRQLARVHDPVVARTLVVGLALGGPEFQRQ